MFHISLLVLTKGPSPFVSTSVVSLVFPFPPSPSLMYSVYIISKRKEKHVSHKIKNNKEANLLKSSTIESSVF